jgi:hypothetical protein
MTKEDHFYLERVLNPLATENDIKLVIIGALMTAGMSFFFEEFKLWLKSRRAAAKSQGETPSSQENND